MPLGDTPQEHRMRDPLTIELTDEQVRLYLTSAVFKARADDFVQRVAPIYMRGAAVEAEQADAEFHQRLKLIEQADAEWRAGDVVFNPTAANDD